MADDPSWVRLSLIKWDSQQLGCRGDTLVWSPGVQMSQRLHFTEMGSKFTSGALGSQSQALLGPQGQEPRSRLPRDLGLLFRTQHGSQETCVGKAFAQ